MSIPRKHRGASFCVALSLSMVAALGAQERPPATPPPPDTAKLKAVKVVAPSASESRITTMQNLTLPSTASITASKVTQTVNGLDPEDAVKYLPSVFIRKRNYGDTQATIETRLWGVSSSARSLVFADGAPLTALIANNNNIGGPRWGLVSPEEISRIDMMYGPFSAAYAGNSMGAVMEITTRQPTTLEGSIEQTQAMQAFSLYDTKRTLGTAQTNATAGDRFGKISFWLSGSYQDSHSQPLTYVTAPTFPTGTTGGFAETNKTGATANVLGASGLLHTDMTNAKIKLAYDITPQMRATYTFGYWHNDANSNVDTYLDASSQPTFASQAGFASGYYNLLEDHTAQSLSLRTTAMGDWDFEAVGTLYDMNKDQQRLPTSVAADSFSTAGRIALLDGTGWSTLDAKAAWHKGGLGAAHIVSFGVHQDNYNLLNPTDNTADWRSGPATTVSSEGDGKTQTQAVWAQDAWTMTPTVKLTVGGRYEWWRAYDGFNANGSTKVSQPTETSAKFSPKAVLQWDATPDWRFTASAAKAYRFATASELYQLITTGTTFTSPDPNLKPDNDFSTELRATRTFSKGSAQVALFQDDVHDAIISQFLPLVAGSSTLYSYVSNVDHVRGRGVEVAANSVGVLFDGLELSGNVTGLDARTLALSGRASATAPAGTAVGKFLPNIPKWRAAFSSTYHVDQRLGLSLGGRYSSKMFTTLDNTDVHPNTYQGFTEWFSMDARATYKLNNAWFAALGVDNLLNRKYFLFHPFPERTLVASLKYSLR